MKITRRKITASTNTIKIPAPFDKYYRLMSDKEYEETFSDDFPAHPSPCEEIEGYDIECLAYATAKPQWEDMLLDAGIDIVELVSESGGEPFLAYAVKDRVYPVTVDDINAEDEDWDNIEESTTIEADSDDDFDEDEENDWDDIGFDTNSGTIVPVIEQTLGVPEDVAELIYTWYDIEDIWDDFDSPQDFARFLKDDIYDMADACDDEAEKQKVLDAIDASTDVTASEGISWMGKYKNIDGEVKKVYFYLDSRDFDEAEEYFEDIIPEAYTRAILLGKAPSASAAERDGFVCMDAIEACDIMSAVDTGLDYWYYSRHGMGPGTIPRDVTVLDWYEEGYKTWMLLDKMLTTQELNDYDLKEEFPPEGAITHNGDIVEACDAIMGTEDVEGGNRMEGYRQATERSVYPGSKIGAAFYKGYKIVFDALEKIWNIWKGSRIVESGFADKNEAIDFINTSLVAASTKVTASEDVKEELEVFKSRFYGTPDDKDSYDGSILDGWCVCVGYPSDEEGYNWACFTDENWDKVKDLPLEEIHEKYADDFRIEGGTVEDNQKEIDKYLAKQNEMIKQLDDLQNDMLNKAAKSKRSWFGRKKIASADCTKIDEDEDSISYVVSSDDIEGMSLVRYGDYKLMPNSFAGCWDVLDRNNDLIKSGFKSESEARSYIDEQTIEGSTEVEASGDPLVTKIREAVVAGCEGYLTSPEGGFLPSGSPKEDRWDMTADEMYVVDVVNEGARIKCEVRAELGYTSFEKMIDKYLDPAVQQFDNGAYFEMEEPGIATAFIWLDSIKNSTDVEGAIDPDAVDRARDRALEPPYEEPEEEKPDLHVTFKFEGEVEVKDDGDWDFVDDTYKDDIDDYSDEGLDQDTIDEDFIQMLVWHIPDAKGKYKVSGEADLVYEDSHGNYSKFSSRKSDLKDVKCINMGKVETKTEVEAAMTEAELDDAILNDKPFDLESFKKYKTDNLAEEGVLTGEDIKEGDTIKITEDASEVDLGTVVKVLAINDPKENWIEYTFRCEVIDNAGQNSLEEGKEINLHFDGDEFVGILVDDEE